MFQFIQQNAQKIWSGFGVLFGLGVALNAYLNGKIIPLNDLVQAVLDGALFAVGLALIITIFNNKYIEIIKDNTVILAIAGMALIYISLIKYL